MKKNKNADSLKLSLEHVNCLQYFITSYFKNMHTGKLEEAHHDSGAVTFVLAAIFKMENGDDN